jgi:hypothetical protein
VRGPATPSPWKPWPCWLVASALLWSATQPRWSLCGEGASCCWEERFDSPVKAHQLSYPAHGPKAQLLPGLPTPLREQNRTEQNSGFFPTPTAAAYRCVASTLIPWRREPTGGIWRGGERVFRSGVAPKP